MFIQEQLPKLEEMHDVMQDAIIDIVANNSPITAIYTTGLQSDIAIQFAQWYDLLNSLIFF